MRRPDPGMARVAGLAVLLCALAGPARAQEPPADLGPGPFGGIRVDVRPFLDRGGGAQAQALRADLTRALRHSFADRLGPGPTLVVRVRGLSLNPYAGGQGDRGGYSGGGVSDYLDGEALVVGRGGAVLARHPQLSVLPASSGGAWFDPASERRRVAAIAEHYAAWLRRSLPDR